MNIYGNSVGHPLPDPRKGMEMSGPINMDGQAIKGLNAPTADDEAVNWGSVKNAAGVGIPLPLGLEYGGVGATDPKTARENLEITPENIGAEPAGAMRMELLWENASPTSDFAAQEIIISQLISANDDSFLGVVYDGQSGVCQWGLAFVKVSTLKKRPKLWLKTAIDLGIYRTIDIDFATGKLTVGSGYLGDGANGGFCVPVNIFLVKGASA